MSDIGALVELSAAPSSFHHPCLAPAGSSVATDVFPLVHAKSLPTPSTLPPVYPTRASVDMIEVDSAPVKSSLSVKSCSALGFLQWGSVLVHEVKAAPMEPPTSVNLSSPSFDIVLNMYQKISAPPPIAHRFHLDSSPDSLEVVSAGSRPLTSSTSRNLPPSSAARAKILEPLDRPGPEDVRNVCAALERARQVPWSPSLKPGLDKTGYVRSLPSS